MGEVTVEKCSSYMKRMGSDSDKGRQGIWNETGRYFDNHIQGLKSLKRQKTPAKSFVWADELKRQFTYTLKPSKCSNTDIQKVDSKSGNGDGRGLENSQEVDLEFDKVGPEQKKFFSDVSIEKIFFNSDYFKMKSGNVGSVSFCSGENGENRWTIEANAGGQRAISSGVEKTKVEAMMSEENSKLKKWNLGRRTEQPSQADELKRLGERVDGVMQEMKSLSREFGSVRMDLKTIEKLLRLQKQVSKSRISRKEGVQGGIDEINSKLGKFSEEVEKAAQELRDFVDNNRTLLVKNEELSDSPDFDKIINNLHRLSETAYQPKIIQTSKGAKFEVPREMPISLYSDGILIRNADFRKYTDARAELFLRDIEDGFFPSELWPEYPCGVPFQVTDRRFENFSGGNFEFGGPGSGRRLGSLFDGKPSSMVYLSPTKHLEAAGDGEKEKRRPRSLTQEQKRAVRLKSESGHTNGNVADEAIRPKPISLKVRLGTGREGYLNLSVMPDEKMNRFQDALFKKLCEKYHEEYVGDSVKNKNGDGAPDFEIHVYGRKPFRLSENLNSRPADCGIFSNCVVNITEIQF